MTSCKTKYVLFGSVEVDPPAMQPAGCHFRGAHAPSPPRGPLLCCSVSRVAVGALANWFRFFKENGEDAKKWPAGAPSHNTRGRVCSPMRVSCSTRKVQIVRTVHDAFDLFAIKRHGGKESRRDAEGAEKRRISCILNYGKLMARPRLYRIFQFPCLRSPRSLREKNPIGQRGQTIKGLQTTVLSDGPYTVD
jgi:hypothetical protein